MDENKSERICRFLLARRVCGFFRKSFKALIIFIGRCPVLENYALLGHGI